MDPDLEALLFALVFFFYVVHKANQAHVDSAPAPERRNRRKGVS
jgi:hypothetical protein